MQVATRIEDHQIIENATGVVGEQRIALLARRDADDVDRYQRLKRLRGVGTV